MKSSHAFPHLVLSDAALDATYPVCVYDEYGKSRDDHIAAERPLTIYLDKREIVTLMTIGGDPELLVLGWLRNQGLIQDIHHLQSIQVDWEAEAAAVTTIYRDNVEQQEKAKQVLDEKLAHKTVTTGCGQGTVFGNIVEGLKPLNYADLRLSQQHIYDLLAALRTYNEVYKRAGAVHGCALCQGTDIVRFVEDVGRHNAVDAIAGYMWAHDIKGADKIFYTTGRLTSEMVIKVAQMGVPILLSRSGVTQMGLELAQQFGVILVARAKGKHFLIYHGHEKILYDVNLGA